jgi:hypothetical protein
MSELLQISERLEVDNVHYYDSSTGDLITSTSSLVDAVFEGQTHRFLLPIPGFVRRLANPLRLARRLVRSDKSNVVVNAARDGLVILYLGCMYFYDLKSRNLSETGRMRQCRNVLHGGVAVTDKGLYFGEYGTNASRDAVPVWRSVDDGRSWKVIYEFSAGTIKHIHGIYPDPYSTSLWIPTGDFKNECYVVEVKDPDFNDVVFYGDGEQEWRSVSMMFEKTRILWAMDTQLGTAYLQVFDRQSGTITQGRAFPGPVWYTKLLTDGITLLQSTVEQGSGLTSDCAHLYASRDLENWTDLLQFKKDILPEGLFKYGVIAFAEGPQSSKNFMIFGEALKRFDGLALRVSIRNLP